MEASKKQERPLQLIANLFVQIQPELKELANKAADAEEIPLNHFIARLLANHLKRPDLATIPYKRMGRPRKQLATK